MHMPSKTDTFKILEDLSLKELEETQNYITNLIAKSKKPGAKPLDTSTANAAEHERQERFYTIFSCKFKRLAELTRPAFSGIVVDVSKDGLRLKTTEKTEVGTVLVTFQAQELPDNSNLSAIAAESDVIQQRAYLAVVRVKEVGGLYEIGCKLVHDNDAALDGLTEQERQERFYASISCKFKRLTESKKPAFQGTILDVSKDGLRLKTTEKMEVGTILVTFQVQEPPKDDSLPAVAVNNDAIQKKACMEVVRVKEVEGQYEIGCKLIRPALDSLI